MPLSGSAATLSLVDKSLSPDFMKKDIAITDPHQTLAARAIGQREDRSIADAGDFDFLMGDWRVRHRKLKRRLAGDDEWREFRGETICRAILGGAGNIDDNILEQPDATYRAVTLRLFDPKTALWSIWWISDRSAVIEPPVHGRFANGVGTFLGDDNFEGQPIRVRFIWSAITEVSAQWEQAFSPNDGATWETNWVMEFERTA